MIFITVGSMFPFDRFILAMDEWACEHPNERLFAQIGAGIYQPRYMEWVRKISPSQFKSKVREASIIVAHAGMGSVITALEFRRPIVLLPRRATLGEHTTEHQVDTAKWLKDKPGIFVSMSEDRLNEAIARASAASADDPWQISSSAPADLTERVRQFISYDSTVARNS